VGVNKRTGSNPGQTCGKVANICNPTSGWRGQCEPISRQGNCIVGLKKTKPAHVDARFATAAS
jgi:hypothetical protein